MNKRNVIAIIGVMSLMVSISGCSSDGGYEKLMEKADKAMVDFDIDQAIGAYEKVLEIDPKNLPYGESRIMMVESLLANANNLKASIEELKQSKDTLEKQYKKLEYNSDKVDEVLDFSYRLNNVHSQLEEYPSTKLYKDVAKMKKEYEKNVEKKLISTLKQEIEKDTKDLLFDSAEDKIEKLASLHGGFPDAVGDVEEYRTVIDDEKNKYIAFPFKIKEVNETLYENSDIGKITLLGDNVNDGKRVVYYKFEGDLRFVASEVGLKTKTILSNGEYRETDNFSWSNYDGYTIGAQRIADAELSIERIDYRFNFMEEGQTKTVQYGKSDSKEVTIDGILALPEQNFNSPIVFEDNEKKVEIKSIQVLRNEVNLVGKVTAKKDLELKGKVNIHRPIFDILSARSLNEELFSGISKDFELNFNFDEAIHNDEEYIQIYFMDFVFNLNLQNGKEFTGGTVNLIDTVYNVDGKVRSKYSNDGFLVDVDGKTYANAISLNQYFGWFSNSDPTKATFRLNQKYKNVKMSIGLEKAYAEAGFGTSKVSLIGDGKVLKEVSLPENAKTVPVELNVSSVNKLEIIVSQSNGESGQQRVIIGNGILSMK